MDDQVRGTAVFPRVRRRRRGEEETIENGQNTMENKAHLVESHHVGHLGDRWRALGRTDRGRRVIEP